MTTAQAQRKPTVAETIEETKWEALPKASYLARTGSLMFVVTVALLGLREGLGLLALSIPVTLASMYWAVAALREASSWWTAKRIAVWVGVQAATYFFVCGTALAVSIASEKAMLAALIVFTPLLIAAEPIATLLVRRRT